MTNKHKIWTSVIITTGFKKPKTWVFIFQPG